MALGDRRTQILEAVVPVILDRGVEVTSRELARAAGVAEGTLYRTFGDKTTLLRAVLRRQRTERLTVPDLTTERGTLEAFITAAVETFVSRFSVIVALTMALGPLAQRPDDEAMQRFAAFHDEIAAALLPFESRLRVSRDAAADLLLTLSYTAASQWSHLPVHATSAEVLTVLVYGLVVDPEVPVQ